MYRLVVLILNSSFRRNPHTTKVSCQIMGQEIATDKYCGGKHNSLQIIMVKDYLGYFLQMIRKLGSFFSALRSTLGPRILYATCMATSGTLDFPPSNKPIAWPGIFTVETLDLLLQRSTGFGRHHWPLKYTFSNVSRKLPDDGHHLSRLSTVSSLSVFFGLLLSYTNFKAPISMISVCQSCLSALVHL